MKARKILSAVLAIVLLIGVAAAFCGCEKKGDKLLRVGVKSDVIGFGYKDPSNDKYSGLEIELAEKLADELGYDGVEFTAVTAATRTGLLDSGDLDCVLATFTITEERKESHNFTTPYFTDAVTVLIETSSGIKTLNDLIGKTVGVSTSSTSAFALIKEMSEKGLFPGYEAPETSSDFDVSAFSQEGMKFSQFSDYPAISNALAAGTVDAFCVDKSILAAYKNDARMYIAERFSPQEYGVATTKDSPLFDDIEKNIKKWLEDGTIDSLINKYGVN